MTAVDLRPTTHAPGPTPPSGSLPRLLPGTGGPSFDDHLRRWGPLEAPVGQDELERSGLRGRGGAGFPTAVKVAAVRAAAGRRRRRPVVVANATEGEPASAKDATLLVRNPHLVLDGIAATVRSLGADRAVLCIAEGASAPAAAAERALAERRPVDTVAVDVVRTPDRYLAGEESALVNWLTSRRALPTLTPPRPSDRGVDGRPTLVENVETLADMALIARFGSAWWRGLGTDEEPGSMLVTVTGGVERPGVYEVALGSELGWLLSAAGAGPAAGVLVGGYFGTWLTPGQLAGTALSRASLGRLGASPGCGVVAVVPASGCPLAETARVADWLAGQSAGQCGPCANGLPAIAGALRELVDGDPSGLAAARVHRWSAMVRGRGACKLPDGAVGLVLSALDAFGPHLEEHRVHGPCPGTAQAPVLPVPARRGWRS